MNIIRYIINRIVDGLLLLGIVVFSMLSIIVFYSLPDNFGIINFLQIIAFSMASGVFYKVLKDKKELV